MSEEPTGKKPADADNPYNIDFERERILKRRFQFLIGGSLILAFILLVMGYAMDAIIASKTPDIAPVTPYETPARPGDEPVTSR